LKEVIKSISRNKEKAESKDDDPKEIRKNWMKLASFMSGK
jgi:hypothetical protein